MAHRTLPVRLLQSVGSLGRVGDVRTVRFGFARNYLVPLGFALPVSDRRAARALARQARQPALPAERGAVVTIAETLNGRSVTLIAPANADGTLFGALHAEEIAGALDTDPIFRMEPIKHTGEHVVTLDFGHDITATATVTVRPAAAERSRRSRANRQV
jgi:large subunit ribosomal protein L9